MTLWWVFVQPVEKSFQVSQPSYLQKACELDHSPAQPGHVGLHQTHLVNIDSQEPLEHAAVLGDHRARDQVAVVWEEGDREPGEVQSATQSERHIWAGVCSVGRRRAQAGSHTHWARSPSSESCWATFYISLGFRFLIRKMRIMPNPLKHCL